MNSAAERHPHRRVPRRRAAAAPARCRAARRAAARGGERAGDEALPVAGDGVGEHQRRAAPVEDVHAGVLAVRKFVSGAGDPRPTPPRRRCSMWSGSVAQHRRVPRPRPADEVEQPVDDPGGEAPQDQSLSRADQEARARSSRRVPDREPVRRVEQLARSAPGTPRAPRAGRRRRTGARLAPPAEHRGHREVARRQPQLAAAPRNLDPGRVEPGLLLRLAQRGRARRRRPGRASRRGRRPGRGGSACRGPAR